MDGIQLNHWQKFQQIEDSLIAWTETSLMEVVIIPKNLHKILCPN